MKIVHIPGGEYPDVLGSYDRYEDFDDGLDDVVFFYGYNSIKNNKMKLKYADYKRKVYLNLEAPCSFLTTEDAVLLQEYFDQVYTICPYTAEWLNKSTKTEFIPIIQPYREEHFEEYKVMTDKRYDVIYHGGVHSKILSDVVDAMMEFDYAFVNLFRDGRSTHRKVRSKKKWELIAASKCSVAVNLLFPNQGHISNIRKYRGWWDNAAFKQVPMVVIPQAKARIIEAAACHTLNLVMKDDWNVIEYWFSPDEFVYWETLEELRYLIDDVSKNFDNYVPIIEKAYNRAQKYTVRNFIKMVSENKR